MKNKYSAYNSNLNSRSASKIATPKETDLHEQQDIHTKHMGFTVAHMYHDSCVNVVTSGEGVYLGCLRL